MNQMATRDVVLAILSLVVATFVTRAGMLLLGERLRLSRHVEAALRFAPACALTALIVPEALSPTGSLDLSMGNPRWLAALVAVLFLLRRQSMLGGIGVGMATYGALRVFL